MGGCDSGRLCLNDCVTLGLTVCDYVSMYGSGSHCDYDHVDSGVTVSDYDCVCEYNPRCQSLCLCDWCITLTLNMSVGTTWACLYVWGPCKVGCILGARRSVLVTGHGVRTLSPV